VFLFVLALATGLFSYFSVEFQFCHRPTSDLSFLLAEKAQHRPSLPRGSPSPIPPVRLGFPHCNHGGDEDEVPLSEKGEASPGTVAPLLVCHSCRGFHVQPGLHPQDGAPQEGRGTQVLLKLISFQSRALLFLEVVR